MISKQTIIILFSIISSVFCYLRPQETANRQTKILDGIWLFRLALEQGLNETSDPKLSINNDKDLIPIAVPSSFNDLTQNSTIRDHVGWFQYKRDFIIHESFFNSEINDLYIHFGSVNYHCEVYINDKFIGSHSGGHLPFEFRLGRYQIANTHTPHNSTNTIYPPGFKVTENWFDFFNYAGIHRTVTLLTKPKTFIKKVDFNFIRENDKIYLKYNVDTSPLSKEFVKLTLIDHHGKVVLRAKESAGKELIENPDLWWPYTMNDNRSPSLYKLNVKLNYKTNGSQADEVEIRTGIRFIEIKDNKLFINSRRAYLTGFGKHEDGEIHGRGLDLPMLIKDFNLIKWIQANSFRTSHYPDSEELMDLADEYGVLIIDECPAVSLISFEQSILNVHKQQLEELVSRDKHHLSVLFWSVANEAESQKPESDLYFKEITSLVRSLDPTRPITAAINKPVDNDYLSKYLDVIMLNRYVSWYSNTGRLELIRNQINHEFELFYKKYSKPMLISEYGADTVAGLHQNPSRVFSEDFQVEYLKNHFEIFDDLIRQDRYFIGELYWNFADFMTKSDYTRVLGNKKGLFTRDRQPKASAKVMRCRYSRLAAQFDLREFQQDNEIYC